MMPYLERFPLSEKKYTPKKKAPIGDVENLMFELEKMADNCGDDDIRSSIMGVIADTCEDRDICQLCYTKIDEAWLDEGLIRSCNCKSVRKAV